MSTVSHSCFMVNIMIKFCLQVQVQTPIDPSLLEL